MPDISLLQHESYGPEQQENRLPGIISTVALVLLIVVLGGYVGFVLTKNVFQSSAENFSKSIENLKAQQKDVADTVNNLKALGTEAGALKALRVSHATPTKLFSYVEKSTHPLAHFLSGIIDVEKGSVTLQGSIASALALSRQAEIYEQDKTAGTILDFSMDGIGYGEKHSVVFNLTLHLPPNIHMK